MLRRKTAAGQRGDTLIEVTFALSILGMVLLGATVVAMTAFRTGQTARERTQVSQAAQEQMEALRSFRDNHTWAEFRGGGVGYQGIDSVPTVPCDFDSAQRCFHMALTPNCAAVPAEWTPVTGPLTPSSPCSSLQVPTALVEITAPSSPSHGCYYTFELHYAFDPLGGGTRNKNQIVTKLSNLRYALPIGDPPGGGCS